MHENSSTFNNKTASGYRCFRIIYIIGLTLLKIVEVFHCRLVFQRDIYSNKLIVFFTYVESIYMCENVYESNAINSLDFSAAMWNEKEESYLSSIFKENFLDLYKRKYKIIWKKLTSFKSK